MKDEETTRRLTALHNLLEQAQGNSRLYQLSTSAAAVLKASDPSSGAIVGFVRGSHPTRCDERISGQLVRSPNNTV